MFVVCTNDSPFCIIDVDSQEQADKMCKEIQDGFDNRKTEDAQRKVYVYTRKVPVIGSVSQISFPIWDSSWPTINK